MNMQLTNVGINALLRALSGANIVFTNIKIGNGAAQSAATATDLSNPLKTLAITAVAVANQKASLSVTLSNAGVEEGFRLTEIGIFVQDQDDGDEEILYAYGTEPEATADYVAATGDSVLEEQITIDAFVSNAENVSALINESTVYATKANFDAHVADMSNPHRVTKAQVGLGDVPNVATNDQTPSWTAPTSNAELISGERLTITLGKVARAVASLISHLANRNNPHKVTATQVNAAAKSHTHSAADVTTGTLGVSRGGTGKGSWSAKRLLYASNSGTLEQIEAPTNDGCVLWGNVDQVPVWAHPFCTDYGSYSGTGKTGASNKNSLQFNEVPGMIFIRSTSSATGGFSWAVLFVNGGSSSGFCICDASSGSAGVYRELHVSAAMTASGGAVISWYSDSTTPAHQMNHSGSSNYMYTAIY